MYKHRVTRLTTLALVVGAIAAPAAMAQPADIHASTAIAAAEAREKQDLRSADARDAAIQTPVRQDLRSPDTVDAAIQTQVKQDLRSPDAVDAAADRGTYSAPEVVVVKVDEPRSQPVADGLDWGDAGIGAGVLVGLGVLALGGGLVVTQRRHGRTVLSS